MGKKSLFVPTSGGNGPGKREEPEEEKTGGSETGTKQGAGPGGMSEAPDYGCHVGVREEFFEPGFDPMKRVIAAAVGCAAFLVVVLLVASAMNAGRYYVKESRGAVEIWKGDFTPDGRYRIMVLQGARWEGDRKDYYGKKEVLEFASNFYVKRALDLADAKGVKDYDRMGRYLDKAVAVNLDAGNVKEAETLKTVARYVREASILDTGEADTAPIVDKKLAEARHAMAALLSAPKGGEISETR